MDNRPEPGHGCSVFHQPARNYVVIPQPDASLTACVSNCDGFWSGTPEVSLLPNEAPDWAQRSAVFGPQLRCETAALLLDVRKIPFMYLLEDDLLFCTF